MAINFLQVKDINQNLLIVRASNTYMMAYEQEFAGQRGSEIPLVPDNLNKALVMLTCPMGTWDTHSTSLGGAQSYYIDDAHRVDGCWGIPMGSRGNAWSARPRGAYFIRGVIFSDEVTHFGYLGSVVGGMINCSSSLDAVNGGNIDYEPTYGHGALSWPRPNSLVQAQYRDAANLPADGGSRINLTGSAWTRSHHLHPVYYTAHIVAGGTLASGAVSFVVEQRPSTCMTNGKNHFPDVWTTDNVPFLFSTCTAQHYGLLLSRFWALPALVIGGLASSDATLNTTFPASRLVEPRVKTSATFQLNEDYYGIVVDTWLSIYSSKTSFIPVYMLDLATSWPSSTHPRPAGVAYNSTNLDMWALAESGELTHIDMSIEGGNVTPLVSGASALLDASERFGSVVFVDNALYALIGSHSENLAHPPTTQAVGIVRYDISTGTWGTRHSCSLPARHGSRSLREMIAIETPDDILFAALVEQVGDTVVTPLSLVTYSAPLSSVYRVPALQQTVVVKLNAQGFTNPAVHRFKLRYQILQAHAIGITIKSVPAGSPVGTAFTASRSVTKAGASAWDNDSNATPQTTDWIDLAFDPAYDYYAFFYAGIPNSTGLCYDGTTGPAYEVYFKEPLGNALHNQTAFFTGDQRLLSTVPDLTTGWRAGAFHGVVSEVINDSGSDTFTQIVNSGLSEGRCAWQLLVHNYTTNTWNPTALTNAGILSGDLATMHTELICPTSGSLFIQASRGKDRLFIFDYSSAYTHVGTLDDAKFIDVSWGAGASILDAAWNPVGAAGVDLSVVKNSVDNSVLFWLNGAPTFFLGLAGSNFLWDGTEQVQTLSENPNDGSSTSSIVKDCFFTANVGPRTSANNPEFKIILAFADTQVILVHPGGSYGIMNTETITGGVCYLPRYFKYNSGLHAFQVATNWTDAGASPCAVPTTPDTPISGPHGLKFLFGPNTSTTFQVGEFHTVNVAYGQVKFARRGRFTFTMFAGRTFQMTETRTLAQLQAVSPVVRSPRVCLTEPTVSGPSSLACVKGNITWPLMVGASTLNDAPLVVTYDLTSATPGPSIIPPMRSNSSGGMVASTVNGILLQAGTDAWKAFSRRRVHPCNAAGAQDDLWAIQSGGATTALRIDCATPKAVKAYSLKLQRVGTPFGNQSAWKIQGSNDAVTWTDLHSVTGYTWDAGVPGSNLTYGVSSPYTDNLTVTGSYRYYQVVFPLVSGYIVVGSLELYDQVLAASTDFTDIVIPYASGMQYGLKFEVNKGAGFVEIIPRFRSHLGEIYVFDLQVGVQQLKITAQNGVYVDAATRGFPLPVLWSYGSTGVINAARLGGSAAAEGTSARGSFDSQCIGVNSDAFALSIDGVSSQQYRPAWSTSFDLAYRGWHLNGPWAATDTSTFCVHPYFGFVWLSPDLTGTSVQISYAWGRHV